MSLDGKVSFEAAAKVAFGAAQPFVRGARSSAQQKNLDKSEVNRGSHKTRVISLPGQDLGG